LEKRKVKRASKSPKAKKIPDYLRKSLKWKKLQAMNEDLSAVSNSVYKFDDFLRKVSKKMKIKDLKTIKDESYKKFLIVSSTESPRQPTLPTVTQGDESSLDMGADADINMAAGTTLEAAAVSMPVKS
jgi:hypothetical protein